MPNLYLPTQELLAMRQQMEKDDLPEEAIVDTLLANAGEFEKKAIAVYQAADEVDYDVALLDTMIADLQARKALLKSRQELMRKALFAAMTKTGISEISCPFFTISTRKGVPKLEIVNEEEIPDEYVEVEVITKVDKKTLLADLKSGKEVPGAKMITTDATLQVRKK